MFIVTCHYRVSDTCVMTLFKTRVQAECFAAKERSFVKNTLSASVQEVCVASDALINHVMS